MVISRKGVSACYPSSVQLIAATNPCPCGYRGDRHTCNCSGQAVEKYRRRISGPLLDRFDLRVRVGKLDPAEAATGESSSAVRARVIAAVDRASERVCRNRDLSPSTLDRLACTPAARALLAQRINSGSLSQRGYDRIRRVALTISDLAGEDRIEEQHVGEALSYRVDW